MPRIRMPSVIVQRGNDNPTLVLRALRQQLGSVRLCYERALSRSPQLEGTLTLLVRFERDGSVSSVEQSAGTLTDAAFVHCVEQALARAKLDAREREPALVSVAILFAPGN